MRAPHHLVFLLAILLPSAACGYTLEQFEFATPEAAAEFREFLGELRCVVCQNETLAGSQADVAQIMRKEVYRLVQEGKDETEIKAHLVDRYSDFVLYDPPLKPATYLLWFGPFLLIALGVFFLVRTLSVKRQVPDVELSDEERQRLREVLAARGPVSETARKTPDLESVPDSSQ